MGQHHAPADSAVDLDGDLDRVLLAECLVPGGPGLIRERARAPDVVPAPLPQLLGDMWGEERPIDDIEFVRTVAAARITMPRSMVRLSAGRESMSESTQALCFLAGANSIFTGEKLLTTPNAGGGADAALFAKLGLKPLEAQEPMRVAAE